MKNKLIKNIHFDYVNEMIKILGFYNLADFETCVIYSELKLNQKTICEKYTQSLELFKKIFPQEGFDLRKINYCFENIDQVIAFIKKLFLYLGINYSYTRKNKNIVLRLIQPNNIYNKYIMNLRNIPQNNYFTTIDEKLNESNKSIEISKSNNYAKFDDTNNETNQFQNNKLRFTPMVELMCNFKNSFEKNYIFNKILSLGCIKSFDYFNWIRIRNINGSKLQIGTIVYLEIGGNVYLKKIIDETTKFDEYNYYKYEIDFPSNIFYQYHEIKLRVGSNNSNNNFQALINGCQLKSNVPKSLFEHNISFEHEVKWFIDEKQQIVISDGMVVMKYEYGFYNNLKNTNNNESKYVNFLEKNKNKIQIINYIEFSNIDFSCKAIETLIFIDDFEKYFKDKDDSVYNLMSDEKSIKFIQENFKIKSSSFSICSNTEIMINPLIQEITSKSTFKYYYQIKKLGDGIKHINLMIPKYIKSSNNSLPTYKINIWIEDKTNVLYNLKTFNMNNELKLEFDKNIINLICMDNFRPMLVVEIPEPYIDDWNEINMSIGYIYHSQTNRRIIASNLQNTQMKIIDI